MGHEHAIHAIRLALFNNGFKYVPLLTKEKKTDVKSWPERARLLTIDAAKADWPDAKYLNTGILCDGLSALDVDTDDPVLAAWIVNEALTRLGPAPMRYRGNSPRCALLYRSNKSVSPSNKVADLNGKAVVELHGNGHQICANGFHPNGSPYLWSVDKTANLKLALLTEVSPEQLDDLLQLVATKVEGKVTRTRASERANVTLAADKPTTSDGEQRQFDSVLRKKYEHLRALRDGQGRNQFFNNAVVELSELCIGWGIDPRKVEATLMQAMDENGSFRDHGAEEVQSTFRSAFKKGSAQPRAREFVPNIDTSALISFPLAAIDEKPRPLRRAIADPNPFPVNALGPFYWPTLAIVDKIQCPPAIAALSVLGVASLAIQAHADVVLPRTGHVKPLSLFLVSIGESGERKSAADNEAKRAITDYERDLALAYDMESPAYRNAKDAWESERQVILRSKSMNAALKSSALNHLIEPQAPLTPMVTCPEPTFEGLCQLFSTGHGSLGLFSDEGGHFVGGHALSEDTRLRTAAGLSSLWDGSPIKRVRAAKDGSYVLPGRRLAMHLMLQPNVAAGLLSDPILKDQGLLSRILVSFPQSTAGTRFQKDANAHAQVSLEGFTKALGSIVRYRPMSAPGKPNELTPRHLQFDSASHALWCSFADKVEAELAPFGKYESIKGLANKLPEHAARIAGIVTIYGNFYATHITIDSLQHGITLAEHFACEALRLFDAGLVRSEIALAESLLEWLTKRWTEPNVSVRVIQRIGPNAIRDSKTALGAIATLVAHGWLAVAQPGTLVEGVPVREAWKIIRQ